MNEGAAHVLSCLPLRHPSDVIGDRHLLVIAPHPDDETLGCGGLLAWAAATRRRPRVLFLTDGEGSHPGSIEFPPSRLARVRQQEAINACAALGLRAGDVTFLGLPDSGLHRLGAKKRDDVVRHIQAWALLSLKAAVCVTAKTDRHSDHIAAYRLASDALRSLHAHQLFTYPVWTWLQDDEGLSQNGSRLDVAAFRLIKHRALAYHVSQHGLLITDAEDAFKLPQPLLDQAGCGYEVLLHA